MTAVPAPPGRAMRAPAWTLPAKHPDLCGGSHTGCVHREPIGTRQPCPECREPVWSYSWPTEPGGGRIPAHYRPGTATDPPGDGQLSLLALTEEAPCADA